MSTNCLVTKLKGTVSADLEKFGELLYEVPSSAASKTISFNIGIIQNGVISIEGDLELWDYSKTTNYGSSFTNPFDAPNTLSVNVVVNGAGSIRISNKYDMKLGFYAIKVFPTKYGYDMKDIAYWFNGPAFHVDNFDTLSKVNRSPLTGAFSEINRKNLPLEKIELNFTSVTGDLSDFAQYADTLVRLSIAGTPITGNIAALGTLTHLIHFSGYKDHEGLPPLTGTIESFVAAQRAAGRTTASNITMHLTGNNNCYFNGTKITTGSDNNLSWTDTTITYNGVTITA